MTMKHNHSEYRVRGGFLVRRDTDAEVLSRAKALDARRRPFSPNDEEADDPNMVSGEQDEIEIHNHYPLSEEPERYDLSLTEDDEEPAEEGEEDDFVARYPAQSHTVITEDFEGQPHHVVYRSSGEGRAPESKTDIYDMNDARARDSRRNRVKTLADWNRVNASHYGQALDSHPRPPRTLAELNAFNAAHYARKAGRR